MLRAGGLCWVVAIGTVNGEQADQPGLGEDECGGAHDLPFLNLLPSRLALGDHEKRGITAE
ncbi:hypothetical protein RV420_450021 [Roseovarius sp. EC-SD190]|nr:hypothetical protein RV420_450021 [Roseovarius sp. EC-SD190]